MCSKLPYFTRWLTALIFCTHLPLGINGQVRQDIQVNQVDLSQFAAHPDIEEIDQDFLGFIWMASQFGLFRYDGVRLRQFVKSDYSGMPSDDINSILVDHAGNLWIAAGGGLAVMNIEDEVIEPYPIETFDSTSEQRIMPTCLFMAEDSTIWVGFSGNRYGRISPRNGIDIYRYSVEPFPLGNCFEVERMFQDDRGDLFLQVVCLHRVALIQVVLQSDRPTPRLLHSAEIGTTHLFSAGGHIYYIDRSSLHHFNADTQQFESFLDGWVFRNIPGFIPWRIKEDVGASFWIGSQSGHLVHGTMAADTLFLEDFGKVSKGRVQALLKDRSGCMWVGSDDGAFHFSRRHSRFTAHLSSPASEERYGLRMRAIVEAPDGYIYACTKSGLYQFNPFTSNSGKVDPPGGNVSQPYSLSAGAADYLWVGSDGYGLVKFDLRAQRFYDRITIFSRDHDLAGSWVGELVLDSDSTLWVGTNDGINYLMCDDSRLRIAVDFNNKPLLPNVYVHDIKEIRKGQFWLGTSHGLYQMARVGHLPEVYFLLTRYADVPYRIREICITSGTDIWLATEDEGLVHYYPESKLQYAYTEANGLPSDVLYSLLPGAKGELWIGTFEGLSRFDTSAGLFSNFYVSDGLPHNEFNSQSQLIASNGIYYMGTQNGMVSFDPGEFAIDSSDLPMMISGLRMHNTKLDSVFEESRHAKLTSGVHIGPHDNLVAFTYAIADYNKPGGNRFQYMLEGLSSRWHYVGNETELVLPHLNAGDYTLHIRGAGSDGRWSAQRMEIPISVRAAYYNTLWFKLSVVAVLGLIMWLVHRYRLSQVLKLQRMRLQIAEDLHDELGSTLTGIGIQTQLLSATEAESGKVSKLREVSTHIQDAVSRLGDIVWSLQHDSGSVGELMDRVEEQAHMMLDPGGIACRISLPKDDRTLPLNGIVMQNCFLVIKEALTNIVKHSDADSVEIEVRSRSRELFLSVADNGNIVSEGSSHLGGNGLKNMRRRAAKMSGSLTISNHDGFRIGLTVPEAFKGKPKWYRR